jgi:hypothetical protein
MSEQTYHPRITIGKARRPLSNLHEALGAEGALGVNVEGLSFATTLVDRKLCQHSTLMAFRCKEVWGRHLARHAERVAQLRFAAAELAVELSDRTCLHTT